LEDQNSTGSDKLGKRLQDRCRIGEEHQDVTTHGSIKEFIASNLSHIGLDELDIVESSLFDASPSPSDRARITFDTHHFSRSPNKSCQQQSHVPDAGTYVQNSLPYTNPGFAEAPLGIGS
jgi:hypothetical protein